MPSRLSVTAVTPSLRLMPASFNFSLINASLSAAAINSSDDTVTVLPSIFNAKVPPADTTTLLLVTFTIGSTVISLNVAPAELSGSATLNVNAAVNVSGSSPFATVSKPITKLAKALSAGFVAELAKFAIFVPLPDCISIVPLLFANLMPASTKA